MVIEELGIFELRNYARHIGVKRPTTKLKQQLLDEIAQIEQGTLNPSKRETRGRPPKYNDTNVLEAIKSIAKSRKTTYEQLAAGIAYLYNLISEKKQE